MLDVNRLTDAELHALKQRLMAMGLVDVTGRTTEFRERQLHDLRLLPSATDPRPMFVFSAESPRNAPVGPPTEYPKLLWHGETDQEITVKDREEEDAKVKAGYVPTCPAAKVLDPLEELQTQFASLSPEDQKILLDAQEAQRRKTLEDKLASLSDAQLERLLTNAKRLTKKRA